MPDLSEQLSAILQNPEAQKNIQNLKTLFTKFLITKKKGATLSRNVCWQGARVCLKIIAQTGFMKTKRDTLKHGAILIFL